MKIQQLKKIISWADILSFIFGFLGVCFGILSLLALESFWVQDIKIRNLYSFCFTATSISFDFLSVLSALIAYYYGTKLYKKTKKIKREDKPEILKCERYSYRFDFWSFIFGIIGLFFGIISFVTLFTIFFNENISWWATVTSICFDTISCTLVTFAIFYFHKATNPRNYI